jgi:isoquinoline 1-oxidoreductase beta subunit
VKVIWTREEDMRRGRSRPAVWARLEAALGPEGYPSAVRVRAVGVNPGTGSITRGWGGGYAIDHLRLEYAAVPTTMQHGANRAPGFNSNTFMFEQFVDEMAQAAGIDPLQWRIAMTAGNERWQRVLLRLEQETRGLAPLPKGQGRGFAAVEIHDTAAACCAEVEISPAGAVKVRRFVIVVNPGYLLNPRAAEEQVRGSIAWELGYVLHGGLDIEGGEIRNVNFDTYRPLRMSEMPEIQCHFDLSQDGWWGGMGEAAVPLVGPAVGNAIHAAIGKRVRSTPLSAQDLSWA